MSCLASGSMRSRSSAWRPVRPRCLWSTGAPEAKPQTKSLRLSTGGFCGLRPAQRFDFFAFFFFLGAFFAYFLAAFLAFFFEAFFADFFAAFFTAFLADFFAAFFFAAFFLVTGIGAAVIGAAALIGSCMCSVLGLSSSMWSPRVFTSGYDSGIYKAVKEKRFKLTSRAASRRPR